MKNASRIVLLGSMLTFAHRAPAQGPGILGVSVEAAAPVGSLNRAFGLGYGVEAFAKRQLPYDPLVIGIGLGYRRLPASTTWHISVASLELTGDYSFQSVPLAPFVTAGPGLYDVTQKATEQGSVNGVDYSRGDFRVRACGGVFGAGLNFTTPWARVPVALLFHSIPGFKVAGSPVRFSTLSVGVEF